MKSEVSRTCVGCGEVHDKKTMLRIVRNMQGEIVPDETGRANGRGAYICVSESCLEKALKRHGLDRAFKTTVSEETIKKVTEFIALYKQ
ncbi:MAG: YlxR family protein [Lachnospiraceae bacterium]|nr:YlxR family protein [Lachnospiraceae bacterium]MBP1585198.1 YlxR family protein [Lachnospiraceae bacterium]